MPHGVTACRSGRPDGARSGTRSTGLAHYRRVGVRLRQAADDAAADPGLRAGGLAGRPAGLDRREVLGLDRLRRSARECAQPRRAARQRDAVLDHRRRGVVGAAVLGELRAASAAADASNCHRGGGVPEGEPASSAAAGAKPATNITHWTTMPRGGHFAAFEQPGLFVEDVRAFFATLRSCSTNVGRTCSSSGCDEQGVHPRRAGRGVRELRGDGGPRRRNPRLGSVGGAVHPRRRLRRARGGHLEGPRRGARLDLEDHGAASRAAT